MRCMMVFGIKSRTVLLTMAMIHSGSEEGGLPGVDVFLSLTGQLQLPRAKMCLLDMKPFSTSRSFRLSTCSMYFFSFSCRGRQRDTLVANARERKKETELLLGLSHLEGLRWSGCGRKRRRRRRCERRLRDVYLSRTFSLRCAETGAPESGNHVSNLKGFLPHMGKSGLILHQSWPGKHGTTRRDRKTDERDRDRPPDGLQQADAYLRYGNTQQQPSPIWRSRDMDSAVRTNQYSLAPPFMMLMLLMVSQPFLIT
ncbi:hypothetical protein EYF80_016020 [Liparis tanakae]|uniref:Uncharacterized protein n=1 Tax=Liparis tanakae TaxID=230148 RepID=A0A4Z2I8V1_9TELE|nr:hypothetical protein EYF80_016020 [Liparis tanakae]